MQPKSKFVKQPSFKIQILLLIVIAILAIPLGRIFLFAYSPYELHSSRQVIIQVNKGQTPRDLTRILSQQNLVSDEQSFLWLGKLTRQWKAVKAGEYQVSPSMTPVEIYRILTSGISVVHPLTVREGENMYEIADDLAAKGM